MKLGFHLAGGAEYLKKYRIGATIANAGILVGTGTAGAIATTTTTMTDVIGLCGDTGTYSTVQATVLAAGGEALITVSVRPDLVIKALMSGGATEGTALPLCTNTSASATVMSDATNVGTADMTTGTLWCLSGANIGESRKITSFSSGASFTVTVPFSRNMAIGDTFCFCPWEPGGGTGGGGVQQTALFTQANAIIVAGTGGIASVVHLELNGRSDSAVLFRAIDHIYNLDTI